MTRCVRARNRVRARQECSHDMSDVVASHRTRGLALGQESEETTTEDTADQGPDDDVEQSGIELRGGPRG